MSDHPPTTRLRTLSIRAGNLALLHERVQELRRAMIAAGVKDAPAHCSWLEVDLRAEMERVREQIADVLEAQDEAQPP